MSWRGITWLKGLTALLALSACSPAPIGPRSDSQTNWLKSCDLDAECGDLRCLCGICTLPCTDDASCAALPGSRCAGADDASTVSCGTRPAAAAMCQPPDPVIRLDPSARFQTLSGFGATVGYAEAEIDRFPRAAELEAAMFSELGLDVLRLRNRYAEVEDAALAETQRLLAAAERSLGRPPLVLLSSWSPPGELKQNGSRRCSAEDGCTLRRLASGSFDYAGLGAHWRDSLLAYAAAGVTPDYIGIQNNPDWAPDAGLNAEACKFAPTEGIQQPSPSASHQALPGFAEALGAVEAALADLPARPRLLAPELSRATGMEPYLAAIDTSRIDAIAHHLYGEQPEAIDGESLQQLASLSARADRPLFQTEMQADGLGTASLIHHAVAIEGASMYLQTALVSPRSGPLANPLALIGLEGDQLVRQEPYFAMAHYALVTEPGYRRVFAQSSHPELLASAWLSPDERSLAVIVVNAGTSERQTRLMLDGARAIERVLFTHFEGRERLSEQPATAELLLPPRSLASWTLTL